MQQVAVHLAGGRGLAFDPHHLAVAEDQPVPDTNVPSVRPPNPHRPHHFDHDLAHRALPECFPTTYRLMKNPTSMRWLAQASLNPMQTRRMMAVAS